MIKKWYGDTFKLGVLGGGQLGRMMIQSAMNFDVHVYAMDRSKSAPCGTLAYDFTEGNIQSYDDVIAFGKDKDVLTVEIEHINVEALEQLEKEGVKVFPQPRVLKLIQDKGLQKEFYKKNNIPTAPFHLIDQKENLSNYENELPFIQKMRKGGYDGKGVTSLNTTADFTSKAFDTPSLIEEKVDFEKELSVLVARNEHGEVQTFPVVECEFSEKLNLVEFLFSPANIDPSIEEKATVLAVDVIEKLDMVGLLAVELFLTKDGELLVNEVAPRTHNSGHHTIECNYTSQFEQHLRAILGLPLGDTSIITPGVMINLLGDEKFEGPAVYQGMEDVISRKGVYVHLYGKPTTKPNRKMGHITITNDEIDQAKSVAREVQNSIKVVSN
ncbi:5-(carboxyamino)imidazole ribonucleotide synthase [Brumimicrobium aurantiacum]|uniref:N5-carboxyaminoimidazole ribonucleotide synthase n=1 Tax=Brumimicrobium aurantiacum TaxID=1737063 RepID=A0A3E1EY47_9FLAO|nr:5-(carboxyamino)imidazole ribonucleotide synthase [Brumimicrobium aurantiacum]RFC54476.1 5-(carboxyamino)imidazole ribonucleotide synthase [Brumimicrobium aurantiacum]